MKALILAGGLGTRLRSVVQHLPKPMAEVKGKPFLEYQIKQLCGLNEHWCKPDSWWPTQDGLRETWTEYLKLALYFAGYPWWQGNSSCYRHELKERHGEDRG